MYNVHTDGPLFSFFFVRNAWKSGTRVNNVVYPAVLVTHKNIQIYKIIFCYTNQYLFVLRNYN